MTRRKTATDPTEMKNKIYSEIQQIDLLIKTHDLLVDLCRENSPNTTELAAAASILFSFYSGLKRIFAVIDATFSTDEEDGNGNTGEDLPENEKGEKDRSLWIFTEDTRRVLKQYEEYYRSYLEKQHDAAGWNSMKEIFLFLKINWAIIKKEILYFVEKI